MRSDSQFDARAFAALALFVALVVVVALSASCRPAPPPPSTATSTATLPAPPATHTATATATKTSTATPVSAATSTRTPRATATSTSTSTATPVATQASTYRVYASGWASAYAEGVFEDEVAHKVAAGWLVAPVELFDGYVATTDCAQKGEYILARAGSDAPVERLFVASCAGSDAHVWMLDNRIIGEVDFETWQRWRVYRTSRGTPLEFVERE